MFIVWEISEWIKIKLRLLEEKKGQYQNNTKVCRWLYQNEKKKPTHWLKPIAMDLLWLFKKPKKNKLQNGKCFYSKALYI